MNKTLSVFSLLTTTCVILSCSKENVIIETPRYSGLVDARLISYFESFEYEAALRGIDVDLDAQAINGFIKNIQEDDIAGTCSYQSHQPNVVPIDLEYWNASSPLRREMVVFHELGHCNLGRGHLETAFDNGICTTIMNSGTSDCFVAYNSTNREYYLDELFAQ